MNVTEMETDAPGEAWRTTSGAEPGAVKAASPVLNGEDEETGRKALRLVLTQHNLRALHLGLDGLDHRVGHPMPFRSTPRLAAAD